MDKIMCYAKHHQPIDKSKMVGKYDDLWCELGQIQFETPMTLIPKIGDSITVDVYDRPSTGFLNLRVTGVNIFYPDYTLDDDDGAKPSINLETEFISLTKYQVDVSIKI